MGTDDNRGKGQEKDAGVLCVLKGDSSSARPFL